VSKAFHNTHFKNSTNIIILKPNKTLYDTPKLFHPIILLNILGKLIEKLISERLQFQAISLGFLYPNQVGGLEQKSFCHKLHSACISTTSRLIFIN